MAALGRFMKMLAARKVNERETYEQIYSAGAEFSSAVVRGTLLQASEGAFLRSLAQSVPDQAVLEIGCGTGEFSLYAAEAGARSVLGIDIAPAATERARQRVAASKLSAKIEFQVMDVEQLDAPDGAFGVVIDREVFSSLDFGSAISEIRRVLRPGGALVGLECLGHNPFFNLNRWLNFCRGKRTEWSIRHILKEKHLASLRSMFSSVEIQRFHLFSVLLGPLLVRLPEMVNRPLLALVAKLDAIVLAIPGLNRMAFKVVFVARK